jgi:hypothetical protein
VAEEGDVNIIARVVFRPSSKLYPLFLNAVFGPLLESPFWTQIEASACTFVMAGTFVTAGTYGMVRSAIKEANREGQL